MSFIIGRPHTVDQGKSPDFPVYANSTEKENCNGGQFDKNIKRTVRSGLIQKSESLLVLLFLYSGFNLKG